MINFKVLWMFCWLVYGIVFWGFWKECNDYYCWYNCQWWSFWMCIWNIRLCIERQIQGFERDWKPWKLAVIIIWIILGRISAYLIMRIIWQWILFNSYKQWIRWWKSWASMILNDEVSANAITKRATKHYTVVINTKNNK